MPDNWQPIDELKPGHYATGLTFEGSEIGIYNDGVHILNVASGQLAVRVTHFRFHIPPHPAAAAPAAT